MIFVYFFIEKSFALNLKKVCIRIQIPTQLSPDFVNYFILFIDIINELCQEVNVKSCHQRLSLMS